MTKRVLVLGIVAIVLIAAVVFYVANNHQGRQSSIVLYGNVDIRQVDLGFRVFGRVKELLFEEGDLVQPGQLIAVLDKIPFDEQEDQAIAKVKAIEVRLKNAEQVYNRRSQLVGSGAVSQEDYDDALSTRDQLVADLEEAKAALASAATNKEDTDLFSPTLGTILTRIREPGSVVNVGEPVFILSIASPVWVRAYISEEELGKVYPGMKAHVYTDTETNPVYEGHVGFISPVAEFTPKTVQTTQLRTDLVYRIRVVVDNPDLGLRQGMPVTVKLL